MVSTTKNFNRKMKHSTINREPQRPAAHGVLKLLLKISNMVAQLISDTITTKKTEYFLLISSIFTVCFVVSSIFVFFLRNPGYLLLGLVLHFTIIYRRFNFFLGKHCSNRGLLKNKQWF
jgi:hypothetical protein